MQACTTAGGGAGFSCVRTFRNEECEVRAPLPHLFAPKKAFRLMCKCVLGSHYGHVYNARGRGKECFKKCLKRGVRRDGRCGRRESNSGVLQEVVNGEQVKCCRKCGGEGVVKGYGSTWSSQRVRWCVRKGDARPRK